MKQKFHINASGQVGVCHANVKPCKFGGDDGLQNHFDSRKQAYKFVENKLSESSSAKVSSLKKNKEVDKLNSFSEIKFKNESDEKQFASSSSADKKYYLQQYREAGNVSNKNLWAMNATIEKNLSPHEQRFLYHYDTFERELIFDAMRENFADGKVDFDASIEKASQTAKKINEQINW